MRRVELFADWLEAQVLRLGASVAKAEVVEILEGTGFVKDSDDAWALVNDAYAACIRRRDALQRAYPFILLRGTISPTREDCLPYRFCLWSSLPEQFSTLRTAYPQEYRTTFEALAAQALRSTLPGWTVYETGWSSIAAEGKGAIVEQIAGWVLGKLVDPTVFRNANDGQVDVAVVRTFPDGRSAVPAVLGQCATGVTDWKEKLARPNLDRWVKAVQFSAQPIKLFAVPFALDADSFWDAINESNGLIFDRVRICAEIGDLPADLEGKLSAWLEEVQNLLPEAA